MKVTVLDADYKLHRILVKADVIPNGYCYPGKEMRLTELARTEKQNALLYAYERWLVKQINASSGLFFTTESLHEYLKGVFGIKHTSEMTKEECSEYIDNAISVYVTERWSIDTSEFWKEKAVDERESDDVQ